MANDSGSVSDSLSGTPPGSGQLDEEPAYVGLSDSGQQSTPQGTRNRSKARSQSKSKGRSASRSPPGGGGGAPSRSPAGGGGGGGRSQAGGGRRRSRRGASIGGSSTIVRRTKRRTRKLAGTITKVAGGPKGSAYSAKNIALMYKAHPALKKYKTVVDLQNVTQELLSDYAAALGVVKETMYNLLAAKLQKEYGGNVDASNPKQCYFQSKIGPPETMAATTKRALLNKTNAAKTGAKQAALDKALHAHPSAWYDENGEFDRVLYVGNKVVHCVVAAVTAEADQDMVYALADTIYEDFENAFDASDANSENQNMMTLLGDLANKETRKISLQVDKGSADIYYARMAACAVHQSHSDASRILAAIIKAITQPIYLGVDRATDMQLTYQLALPVVVEMIGDLVMHHRYMLPLNYSETFNTDDMSEPIEQTRFATAKLGRGTNGKTLKKFDPKKWTAVINLPTSVRGPQKGMAVNDIVNVMLNALANPGDKASELVKVLIAYRKVVVNGLEATGMTKNIYSAINATFGLVMVNQSKEGKMPNGKGGINLFCEYVYAHDASDVLVVLLRHLPEDMMSPEALNELLGKGTVLAEAKDYTESATSLKMVILLATLMSGI
jgi:hypothetical protein